MALGQWWGGRGAIVAIAAAVSLHAPGRASRSQGEVCPRPVGCDLSVNSRHSSTQQALHEPAVALQHEPCQKNYDRGHRPSILERHDLSLWQIHDADEVSYQGLVL